MWFILSLSIKNLFRYKRRTIITAIAIAAGIAVFIFLDGWLLGAEMESVRNLVKFETGSARIMNARYWEEHDFLLPKYNLSEPDLLVKAAIDAGYPATARITVLAEIGATGGQDQYPCILAGIDPQTDGRVFALEDSVIAESGSRYLAPDAREILIGRDLARNLGIIVGGTVMVKTKTAGGQFTTLDALVVGLLNTPDPIVNSGMIFMPLSHVQDALLMSGRVTDIVVNIPEYADLKTETQKLNAQIAEFAAGRGMPDAGNIVVKNYLEIASEYLTISQTKRGGTSLMLFMVFLIAAIGVSNTMLIAVFERTKEMGMMRALGMRPGAILVSMIIEATGIGFLGGLAGAFLGILGNLYMINIGIDMSSMLEQVGNIGYRTTGIFHSAWNFGTIFSAFFWGMIFSGIMAIFPSIIALRRDITKSLSDK